MQTLQGWQRKSDPAWPIRWRRCGVAAMLAGLVFGFAWLLYRPFEREQLHVLIISPCPSQQANSQRGQPALSNSQNAGQREIDAAQQLCYASGNQLLRSIQDQLPHARFGAAHSRIHQQAQVLAQPSAWLSGKSTLIIYVSGVLSLEHKQPALCDLSQEALHGGGELLLMPLVEKLQATPCAQVLLFLDVVPPRTVAPAIAAAPLIAEDFLESLERTLATRNTGTPLAVCVAFNSIDHAIEDRSVATPLAVALTRGLQAELGDGQFHLHAFKDQLTASLQNQPDQPSPFWLASVNWPVTARPVRVPQRFTPDAQAAAKPVGSDLSADASADTRAERGMATVSVSTIGSLLTDGREIDLDQLGASQLVAVGRSALDGLRRGTPVVPVKSSVAWLPMPVGLDYCQRHPYSIAWMEHQWQEIEAVMRWSGDGQDQSDLRECVRQLVNVAGTSRLVATPRKSDNVGDRAAIDVAFKPTPSLIVNAIVANWGLMQQPGQDALQVLAGLADAIDSCTHAEDCRAAIEKLASSQAKRFIELQQCHELCRCSVPWATLQNLLRLQLVATRASVDLYCDDPEVQPLLQQAAELMHNIREEIDLRPDSHPDESLDLLIGRALGLYHAAIERQDRLTRQAIEHRTQVCALLTAHPWTRFPNLNRQAALQSVQHLMEVGPQLFADSPLKPDARVSSATITIRQKIEHIETLLKDPLRSRADQIGAIQQFNRALLAAAESRAEAMTDRSAQHEVASPLAEAGALRLFMRLAGANCPQGMHAWIAHRLARLVEANQDQVSYQLQRSTLEEQVALKDRLSMWTSLAETLTNQGLYVRQASSIDWGLTLDAPAHLDLQAGGAATAPCTVAFETALNRTPQLQAEFDDSVLEVCCNDRKLPCGQPVTLESSSLVAEASTSSVSEAATNAGRQASARLRITVKQIGRQPAKEPLVLLVSHAGAQRRAVIHLQTAQLRLVDVDWQNRTSSGQAGQGSGSLVCVLMPNRLNALGLQLVNRTSSNLPLAVRVWAVGNKLVDVPCGALEESVAQRWLSQHPDLLPLAQMANVRLDLNERRVLALTPEAGDFKQSPRDCVGVLVGIVDESTRQTQFEYRPLHVRHPSEYVSQRLDFDWDRQCVKLMHNLAESAGDQAHVAVRLIDWPGGQLLAHSSSPLSSQARQIQSELSMLRSRSNRCALITEVDGWPGVSVSLIDRHRQAIVDEPMAQVRLDSALPDSVLPAADSKVEVYCSVWTSLGSADQNSQLRVGWDRNQDRTLDGEPWAVCDQVQSVVARCHGLTATGDILMESRVEPLKFSLATKGLADQRTTILAELYQDQTKRAEGSLAVVIDRQAPTITRTRFVGAEAVLEKPVSVEIDVNDYGLSGAGRVEGAWSLDGQTRWNADLKPVAASLRPNGAWLLTLPTLGLPSGDNMLLVRAIDKAGNHSETYQVSARLFTQGELDAKAASAVTELTGRLLYGNEPQAGLMIELLKVTSGTEQTPSPASVSAVKEEASVIASTKSLDDGVYRLTDVRSGQYVLRVRGIVRGMRVERSRPISVTAPEWIPPSEWRLDKQP